MDLKNACTHKYSQLIFNRDTKAIPERTKSLFNKLQWNNQTSKMNLNLTRTPYKKLIHNGKHLSINPGTIKLSENSTGENLRKPGLVKCET